MQALIALTLMVAAGISADAGPAPLLRGHYRVLTADPERPAPFAAAAFAYGRPVTKGVAWQLDIYLEDQPDAAPLMELRAVTSRDPLVESTEPLLFSAYVLRIPETRETFEFLNVHTGRPLLPAWSDFKRHFVPGPARGTRRQAGLPNTCEYLGHVLTLARTSQMEGWPEWQDAKALRLDPELLIGTGRNFKDAEGKRLPQTPQRQNYTYVPFTEADCDTMIEAGINLFTIAPEQEPFVRGRPVFYLRGAGGKPPLKYPADLYRSNYIGSTMFMDEPTIIMIGDKNIHNTLRYFSDAAALITRRVEARYLDDGGYGAFHLERQLKERNISFGAMRLAQLDYPAWETIYETAWYQLAGGLAGIVHEGRYRLDAFNQRVKACTDTRRTYTAEQMLQYVYAHMRGAARRFGKDWGTAIYGQADPELSPLAMRMAYDTGARYLWYWTSDHEHHLPWPEQLALTRDLRKHAAGRPRGSIRKDRAPAGRVIVIPYGYFLSLENLWWVRELAPDGKNDAARRYRRLMTRAFEEMNKALDAGDPFDFAVEDGSSFNAYRQVIRIDDE